MKPTIGRIVHYVLTAENAEQINRRRTTGASIAQRIGAMVLSEDGTATGALWPVGAQAHIGNVVSEGDVVPMTIIRVWSEGLVNGQAMLDGNDALWVTSAHCSTAVGGAPGCWNWPPRE